MDDEAQLQEKVRRIEALFAGAETEDETPAAEVALERARARLAELEQQGPAIEMQFTLPDQWSRKLFLALCRRYRLQPFQFPRQRNTTAVLRVPRGFLDQVLWPEFQELNNELVQYFNEVTLRVIREAVLGDASEVAKITQALPIRAATD
jgi:hypothetical protein